ncbi:MAG TPA: sulfotransferase domain-containing protein [Actinopolymorphaceae bacterium]|nr:sulfotransferase domain-containing protein [Actinopolymorphaceae bacterium]
MEDFRLVYVGGIGRSGSTLLEVLLGQLPGVCAVGEVVHLWQRSLVDDELCGCGSTFSGCEFWRSVGEEAFSGWERLDAGEVLALKGTVDRLRNAPALLRARPPARLSERITRYTALYDRLYAAVARVSGCPVVVDASKHGSLAACLRHRYPERLRVVHVIRDPRAVAYSWGKQVPRPGATATSAEQAMARYSPGRASVQWMAENAVFSSLARRGVPMLRVRYEDLAAEPDKEFRTVAEFVGHRGAVPFAADSLPAVSSTQSHALSGNPMRFATGPVTVRVDSAWQDELAPRDRATVTLLTGAARRRYGY